MRQWSLFFYFCCTFVFLCILPILVAQQDLCKNEADISAFHQINQNHQQDPTHNPDFDTMLSNCLKQQVIPTPDYVSWCCQTTMKISQPCASCCGWATNCVVANCKWPCTFQSADACQNCFVQYCTPGYNTCVGYDPDLQ